MTEQLKEIVVRSLEDQRINGRKLDGLRPLQVPNIPESISQRDVENAFALYGHVAKVEILTDGLNRRTAIVYMQDPLETELARLCMQGVPWGGRRIGVEYVK